MEKKMEMNGYGYIEGTRHTNIDKGTTFEILRHNHRQMHTITGKIITTARESMLFEEIIPQERYMSLWNHMEYINQGLDENGEMILVIDPYCPYPIFHIGKYGRMLEQVANKDDEVGTTLILKFAEATNWVVHNREMELIKLKTDIYNKLLEKNPISEEAEFLKTWQHREMLNSQAEEIVLNELATNLAWMEQPMPEIPTPEEKLRLEDTEFE